LPDSSQTPPIMQTLQTRSNRTTYYSVPGGKGERGIGGGKGPEEVGGGRPQKLEKEKGPALRGSDGIEKFWEKRLWELFSWEGQPLIERTLAVRAKRKKRELSGSQVHGCGQV